MRRLLVLVLALAVPTVPAAAQAWNTDSAVALARRAIRARGRLTSDTALQDYKAQAHGFLFFLGQFGEGLHEPPRLIKADELALEVYWKAPGLSKQRIVGWRDQAELPTDNVYHRDHLGIVQNNFGDVIRLGEGDEVLDVPHPLSPAGTMLYDFALADTVTLAMPAGAVQVIGLKVRPKDFAQPRIVGTLYVDARTADLVRMTFNFTPKSYRDPRLEDVSIVLDNALWSDRFWLPYRQEIEIRRRGTFLELPARGIIRGRWEIGDYQFNLGLVASWFAGEEITPAPKAERDSFPWREPLGAAIQDVAEPVRQGDLEAVRAQVERIAGGRALSGLKSRVLAARGASDLLHVNRVEGVTPGAGAVWRDGSQRFEGRVRVSYGLADHRAMGGVTLTRAVGRGALEVELHRDVRDVGDWPVVSPIVNSLAAQEFGDDYGDYFLAQGGGVTVRHAIGVRGEWSAGVVRERPTSLAVRMAPATGRFRPNPAVGGPALDLIQLRLRRKSEGFAVRRDVHAELVFEAGAPDGGTTYARLAGEGHLLLPLGGTRVLLRAQGGTATAALPAHRSFTLGGRGTLLGDPFRVWGGRRAALVHAEWRLSVPFVRIGAGPFVRTPGRITLAPFAAAGWAGGPVAGTPWLATPGARVTIGTAFEWLGALRIEAGYGVQTRRVRFAFDLTRDFWSIL
jgi:hypothetical protein